MITALILLTWTAQLTTAGTLDKRVEAYDCSNPVAIEDRALGDSIETCTDDAHTMKMDSNVTFQLLYHEPLQRLTGHRCEILDTRNVQYCGKYDHQTIFNRYAYQDLAKPPTPKTCRDMIRHGQFRLPDQRLVGTEIGTATQHFWEEVGTTTSGTSFLWPDRQLHCTGGDWRIDGTLYKNMVVDHRFKVKVTKEEFSWDGQVLLALSDNTRIPCSLFDQDCQTAEATYLWSNPLGYCPLAHAKEVTGMVVEDDNDRKVFMSTDNSLVRLVMQHQESQCERMVWATNYENVYLASTTHSKPFTRNVDPTSISMHIYVNNRDDYLYHHLIDQINDELGHVLKHDCERRKRMERKDFFIAHRHPGIETFAFGNGTFATASGEVLYYHRCRREIVTAAELPYCFNALPVFLNKNSPLRTNFNSSQWYVEPLTHRLTRYATLVPCTKNFVPKYQLLNRRWITADPVLHMADPPKPMARPEFILRGINPDVDPSQGGVYDEQDMKAWEAFTMIGRIRDAVVGRLSLGATQDYTLGPMDPLFQTPSSWFKEKLEGIYGFLVGYGNISAVFISLVFIWRILATTLGWCYGGCAIYKDLGKCAPQILWALCPTWLLMRDRTRQRRARRPTEERELSPMVKYSRVNRGESEERYVTAGARREQQPLPPPPFNLENLGGHPQAHQEEPFSNPARQREIAAQDHPTRTPSMSSIGREIREAINNPTAYGITDSERQFYIGSRSSLARGPEGWGYSGSEASSIRGNTLPRRNSSANLGQSTGARKRPGSSSVYPELERQEVVTNRLRAVASEAERLLEAQKLAAPGAASTLPAAAAAVAAAAARAVTGTAPATPSSAPPVVVPPPPQPPQ